MVGLFVKNSSFWESFCGRVPQSIKLFSFNYNMSSIAVIESPGPWIPHSLFCWSRIPRSASTDQSILKSLCVIKLDLLNLGLEKNVFRVEKSIFIICFVLKDGIHEIHKILMCEGKYFFIKNHHSYSEKPPLP